MALGNTFQELNFVTEYQNEAFPHSPLDPGIYGPVAYGTVHRLFFLSTLKHLTLQVYSVLNYCFYMLSRTFLMSDAMLMIHQTISKLRCTNSPSLNISTMGTAALNNASYVESCFFFLLSSHVASE
jgi:hypothetical protein